MSFFQVFASYCSLFSGRAYGFCFFLDGFFSSATLRTVWGYEILIFIFKSEPVSKNETINKSLWSLTVGEVSSEVNSNSTHLPVVAVWATQGHNCFWALWMQTHACVHSMCERQPLTQTQLKPVIVVLVNAFMRQACIPLRRLLVSVTELGLNPSVTHSHPLENSLCFQTIRGIIHLCEPAIGEVWFYFYLFIFFNQHSPLPAIYCNNVLSPKIAG